MAVFNPTKMTAQLQALADSFIATTGAPASLLTIAGSGLEVSVAAGLVDADRPAPATTDNTYEIGSQTKMMVAAVALQLAEAGVIDLDRPATDYLEPSETTGIANVATASLAELLAMRSGIPDYTTVLDSDGDRVLDQMLLSDPDQIIGVADSLDIVRGQDAVFAPGTGWDYSNTNYTLLGRVIETVTGAPLADVLSALIFDPLGMDHTFLDDHTRTDPRLSAYYPLADEVLDVTDAPIDYFAEGGVISTLDDMVTFLGALIGGDLLSRDAMDAMASWDSPDADGGAFLTYGLGLFYLHADDLGDLIGHTGGTFGTETATFAHLQSGRILSFADTLADSHTVGLDALATLATTWDAFDLAAGPITIQGTTATDLRLQTGGGATVIDAGAAKLILDAPAHSLGNAALVFADGSEIAFGTLGDDALTAHGQGAVLRGFAGDDRLQGSDRADRLLGNGGADHLFGRGGGDDLSGGNGDDILRAGNGDDRLIGGAGNDLLYGGAGGDVFVFAARLSNGVREADIIGDFNPDDDTLHLPGGIAAMTESDAGVTLTLAGSDGDTVLLADVTLAMLDADALPLL